MPKFKMYKDRDKEHMMTKIPGKIFHSTEMANRRYKVKTTTPPKKPKSPKKIGE